MDGSTPSGLLTGSMIGRAAVRVIGRALHAEGIEIREPVKLDSPLSELRHEYRFPVYGLDMALDDVAERVIAPAAAGFVARLKRNGAIAISFVAAGREFSAQFDGVIASPSNFGAYVIEVSIEFVIEKRKFLD